MSAVSRIEVDAHLQVKRVVWRVGYFCGAFVKYAVFLRKTSRRMSVFPSSLCLARCFLCHTPLSTLHPATPPPPASTPSPRGGSWRHSSHVRRSAEHPNCCHNRGSCRVGGRAEDSSGATRRSRKHPKCPGDSRSPAKIYARSSSSPFARGFFPHLSTKFQAQTTYMLHWILPLCALPSTLA